MTDDKAGVGKTFDYRVGQKSDDAGITRISQHALPLHGIIVKTLNFDRLKVGVEVIIAKETPSNWYRGEIMFLEAYTPMQLPSGVSPIGVGIITMINVGSSGVNEIHAQWRKLLDAQKEDN